MDKFPIHTEFILSIDNPIAFEQFTTNCINKYVSDTQTKNGLKEVIKNNIKLKTDIIGP